MIELEHWKTLCELATREVHRQAEALSGTESLTRQLKLERERVKELESRIRAMRGMLPNTDSGRIEPKVE